MKPVLGWKGPRRTRWSPGARHLQLHARGLRSFLFHYTCVILCYGSEHKHSFSTSLTINLHLSNPSSEYLRLQLWHTTHTELELACLHARRSPHNLKFLMENSSKAVGPYLAKTCWVSRLHSLPFHSFFLKGARQFRAVSATLEAKWPSDLLQ